MAKKRRKSSRYAGWQNAKRGHKKRTRGSGNQGGKGMAGTGKRADQKKTKVIEMTGGNNYFGSVIRRARFVRPRLKVINLGKIDEGIDILVRKGLAKEIKGKYDINLKGYKVLGEGDLAIKAKIIASAASQSVIEKIKKSGSEIVINSFNEEKIDKEETKVNSAKTVKKSSKKSEIKVSK